MHRRSQEFVLRPDNLRRQIETPKAEGCGEGVPIPSRLGGLRGASYRLPRWGQGQSPGWKCINLELERTHLITTNLIFLRHIFSHIHIQLLNVRLHVAYILYVPVTQLRGLWNFPFPSLWGPRHPGLSDYAYAAMFCNFLGIHRSYSCSINW